MIFSMRKLIALILPLILGTSAFAQKREDATQDSTVKEKKVDFSVMPFLSYNRNLKFMIGAIPMAMYRPNPKDTLSPKSLSGVAAVYTTNNSYFFSFFNKIYLNEDRWRLTGFVMAGDQNSQFYMDDMEDPGFYDYGTKTTLVAVGAQRQIISHLYGGFTYSYAYHHTKYEDGVQPPSTVQTNGLQFNGLYDTRDAVYYPTTGSKPLLSGSTFPHGLGMMSKLKRYSPNTTNIYRLERVRTCWPCDLPGNLALGTLLLSSRSHWAAGISEDIPKESTGEMA